MYQNKWDYDCSEIMSQFLITVAVINRYHNNKKLNVIDYQDDQDDIV
jgi:hypothetical protein